MSNKSLKREMKQGKALMELEKWFCSRKLTIQEVIPPIDSIEQRTKSRCETMFVRMLFTVINNASYFQSGRDVYYRRINITSRKLMKKMILTFAYDKKTDKFINAEVPVFFPPNLFYDKAVSSEGMFFCNFIEVDSSNLEKKKDYQIQSPDVVKTISYDTSTKAFVERCYQAYSILSMMDIPVEKVMRYFFFDVSHIASSINQYAVDHDHPVMDMSIMNRMYEDGMKLTTR